MATVKKDAKVQKAQQRIRITVSSTRLGDAETTIKAMLKKFIDTRRTSPQLKLEGPYRLPTKVLSITTRRAPSGQGTQTFERFKLRVYKRIITIAAPSEVVSAITDVRFPHSVDVVISLL